MTKQEAHEYLKGYLDNVFNQWNDDATYSYLRDCADTLAPPEPNPETGLVPCGCGGKLELRKRSALLSGLRKLEYIHWVVCRKCHWSTMDCTSKEMAIRLANEAMGYREDQ
jgi:hypothetical protein